MAARTPGLQPRSEYQAYWGIYASIAALPNGSANPLSAPYVVGQLEAGDTAYVTGLGQYVCKSVGTSGGGDAVWVSVGPTVGSAAVNFGALPGSDGASVAVTGQSAIVAGSRVQAWIRLVSSVDHTPDEHRVENLKVTAGLIVPGTGFTIYVDCVEGLTYGIFNVDWEWI
jgi:hypothetical protein